MSLSTLFNSNEWMQLTDYPIKKSTFPWEGKCVEAASTIQKEKKLFMFYAGAYNNAPQHPGVAVSKDGIV